MPAPSPADIEQGNPDMYQRIRDERKSKNLTQTQMAQILHMQTTQYQRYESGEREIPFSIAILLADCFGVSLDYLTGRTEKQENEVNPAPSPAEETLDLISRLSGAVEKMKLEVCMKICKYADRVIADKQHDNLLEKYCDVCPLRRL